ncbi:MAG: hypothetical protein K6C34_04925 [Alphaproteobacteria bacterium]|nr:hypothetical protein [Alphaproteobacteria bacterium]
MLFEYQKIKTRVWNFIKNVRGAILIEFAVCMPVLILLLLGLHDIFKMARMQDRTNLVAHEMVQMVQNISQGRTNKKITKADLAYIFRFASYSIYPGKTLYALDDNRTHIYAHFPQAQFIYVKGVSGGKATCVWMAQCHTGHLLSNIWSKEAYISYNAHTGGVITYGTNVEPSSIYPTLTIAEGEVKIIVNLFIYMQPGTDKWADGTKPSVKQAFGLYALSPTAQGEDGYFNAVAIFTPKVGLFDEDGPQ